MINNNNNNHQNITDLPVEAVWPGHSSISNTGIVLIHRYRSETTWRAIKQKHKAYFTQTHTGFSKELV